MPDEEYGPTARQGGGSRRGGTEMLDEAVSASGLEPVFQPVVSIPDGELVGYEALARWPALHDPNPQAVFARAERTGHIDRLDRRCIDAALEQALDHGLAPNTLLMLNCEPLAEYVSPSRSTTVARARSEFRLIFELTERGLLRRPAALLDKVAAMRADGFAVALDDVGVHPDSLALLDVLRPDVIKLDLHLVQSQPSREEARVLAAVLAHQERTGAILLAEGIETDEHLGQALAMGASLGQGHKFGRPAPLRRQSTVQWSMPPMKHVDHGDIAIPFDLTADQSRVRTARKETLLAFTRHIEVQAWRATNPPMLLTALQRAEFFTGITRDRYRELAKASPLVAVFGEDMPIDLGSGVRGVALDPADPLSAEWTVVTLGPDHAAALISRERPHDDASTEDDRLFDFTITYDRSLVTAAARSLLARIP